MEGRKPPVSPFGQWKMKKGKRKRRSKKGRGKNRLGVALDANPVVPDLAAARVVVADPFACERAFCGETAGIGTKVKDIARCLIRGIWSKCPSGSEF